MASFVRIIPNSLWEELEEKGLLKNSFPNSEPSAKEALLSKFPHSLKDSVEKLLASHPNIKWNTDLQLVYNSVPVIGSNIVDLLTNYIVKSTRVVAGSAELDKIFGQSTVCIDSVCKDDKSERKTIDVNKSNKQEPSRLPKTSSKNSSRKSVNKRNDSSQDWTTAEDIKNGRRPQIRKKTLSVNKNSRWVPGSLWFP